jgi:hypothetical protein
VARGDVPHSLATSAAGIGLLASTSKTPSFVPTMMARARITLTCVSASGAGGMRRANNIHSMGFSGTTLIFTAFSPSGFPFSSPEGEQLILSLLKTPFES